MFLKFLHVVRICVFSAFGLLVLAPFVSHAQIAQRSEVGAGLGTFNYTGDLVRNYNFAFSKPAGTVFYRANINQVISLRSALTLGKMGANDNKSPIDSFAIKRANSFNITMIEASVAFEYHFLNWKDSKRKLRFTPYLFGGIALFGISGNKTKTEAYSNVQTAIPFGGGIKYVLNPKYYIALEFGVRKTMFDYLDNISDGNTFLKNYRYGNRYDNDTYYFVGITITRTFYDIPCPTSPYGRSY
jgi:Domain of unknown function (DUF6089)